MAKIIFGGGGGYVTYYMGIAKYLQENYDLTNTQFIGSSAGIVPAFLLSIDYNIDDAFNNWFIPWMNEAKTGGYFLHNNIISRDFFNSMKPIFYKLFNKDTYFDRIKNNKLSICLTDITLKKKLINNWDNTDDLFECMCVSCSLPFVFDNKATTNYKGNEYFDGSFVDREYLTNDSDVYINLTTFRDTLKDWQCVLSAGLLMLNLADSKFSRYYYDEGYENAKNNKSYFSKLKTRTVPSS